MDSEDSATENAIKETERLHNNIETNYVTKRIRYEDALLQKTIDMHDSELKMIAKQTNNANTELAIYEAYMQNSLKDAFQGVLVECNTAIQQAELVRKDWQNVCVRIDDLQASIPQCKSARNELGKANDIKAQILREIETLQLAQNEDQKAFNVEYDVLQEEVASLQSTIDMKQAAAKHCELEVVELENNLAHINNDITTYQREEDALKGEKHSIALERANVVAEMTELENRDIRNYNENENTALLEKEVTIVSNQNNKIKLLNCENQALDTQLTTMIPQINHKFQVQFDVKEFDDECLIACDKLEIIVRERLEQLDKMYVECKLVEKKIEEDLTFNQAQLRDTLNQKIKFEDDLKRLQAQIGARKAAFDEHQAVLESLALRQDEHDKLHKDIAKLSHDHNSSRLQKVAEVENVMRAVSELETTKNNQTQQMRSIQEELSKFGAKLANARKVIEEDRVRKENMQDYLGELNARRDGHDKRVTFNPTVTVTHFTTDAPDTTDNSITSPD